MRLLFALTPILCTVAIPAADDLDAILRGDEQMPWVEIRLGIGQTVIPDVYPITAKIYPEYGGGTLEWTDTMDKDSALSVSYGVIAANLHPFGWVGGVEMVYSQASLTPSERSFGGADVPIPSDTCTLRYQSFGGNALLGGGLALGPHAHVEILGMLGAGAVDMGFADLAFDEQTSGSGWYWNYGVRGGAFYRIGKFLIGAIVEYKHVEVDISQGWLDAETSSEPDASGIGYRLEIGYHIQ